MQTPVGTTPSMVAEGNRTIPGYAPAQIAKAQSVAPGQALPMWRVRDGRGTAHTMWDDAFEDKLAELGLTRDSVYEAPPEMSPGMSGCRQLWKEAA